jgi:hypothetical protein
VSITPDAPPETLNEALVAFTGCIGESLENICSYGLTIGADYVPFDPDPEDGCDDEEVQCSQAWVRVENIAMVDVTDSFGGADCGGSYQLTLEVGVLRCITIPEDGEAPTATDVLVAALQAMDDMKAIQCAAMSCEVWESISAGQWQPSGPLGGQYGGTWSFTVVYV